LKRGPEQHFILDFVKILPDERLRLALFVLLHGLAILHVVLGSISVGSHNFFIDADDLTLMPRVSPLDFEFGVERKQHRILGRATWHRVDDDDAGTERCSHSADTHQRAAHNKAGRRGVSSTSVRLARGG